MNKSEFSQKLNGYYSDSEVDFLFRYIHKQGESDSLSEISDRLLNNEPIDYILGYTFFYGKKYSVNKHVLIPRPETEELVELIIKENQDRKELNILDIGTGSGCIAISLEQNLRCKKVTAVDISKEALSVAIKNGVDLDSNVEYIQENILSYSENLSRNKWDIVVSNPPYISIEQKINLAKNLSFEPDIALYTEPGNELFFYHKILEFASQNMNSNGCVYFEVHQDFQYGDFDGFDRKEIKDMSQNIRFLKYNSLIS